MKIWEQFLQTLEGELGKQVVNLWLHPFRILKFDARNLHLEGRNPFQILWFQEHVAHRAKRHLLTNEGTPLQIHFYLHNIPYYPSKKRENIEEKNGAPAFFPDHLETRATFSNFSSETRHNLILEVLLKAAAVEKRDAYNPIYLYGPKGSGKSHLLMATAHALHARKISAFYVRSKTFIEQVIRAFRTSSLQEFRQVYRTQSTLIIDDVDLLSHKTSTQEEFFHIFNHLYAAKVSMIFSAHCPPHLLQEVEMRLINRFEWGVTLPLPPPSHKEREKILSKIARDRSLKCDPLAQKYLLSTFSDLHGLVRAVDALTLRNPQSNGSIDLSGVRIALQDLVSREKRQALTPEKIVKITANAFGIKVEDILGRAQNKECAFPRQIAMYLCRKERKIPYLQIGKFFSRNHSTVISSIKQIENKIARREEKTAFFLSAIHHRLQTESTFPKR